MLKSVEKIVMQSKPMWPKYVKFRANRCVSIIPAPMHSFLIMLVQCIDINVNEAFKCIALKSSLPKILHQNY